MVFPCRPGGGVASFNELNTSDDADLAAESFALEHDTRNARERRPGGAKGSK